MINKENLDPNKIKIDKQSYKNLLIYCIGYVTIKDLRHVKFNRVNVLFPIIVKISGYIEVDNGNKCLALVPTDKSKGTLKSTKKYRLR